MAKAGETPEAQFKGLAYGQNQQANQASAQIDTSPPYDPTTAYNPQSPSEQFLYGPSTRPNEPVTAGAPFGPGPDFTAGAYETQAQFVQRISTELSQGANATPEVKQFAARVQAGE